MRLADRLSPSPMRVATWNLKLGVSPRAKPEELWAWAEERIDPDVMVFTEAKVPKTGTPDGWNAVYIEGGIGKGRRWGTIIAGRGDVEVREVESTSMDAVEALSRRRWPAAVLIVEVLRHGAVWGTVVGIYGLTTDLDGQRVGHGRITVPAMLDDLAPLFQSSGSDRIIVAGDLNLHPRDVPRQFSANGLVDLIEWTGNDRGPLKGCTGCSMGDECCHMWTHRNGTSPNAKVQQIDFMFATEQLAARVGRVRGGLADFPDVWDMSDHAPVIAEFN